MSDGLADTAAVILFLLVLSVGVGIVVRTNAQGQDRIRRWAKAEGLSVVSIETRSLFLGPFQWKTDEADVVYYVTVESPSGTIRHAWARFGGCCSDELEVRWNE